MSEYRYYEFAAVDRPLTPEQQAELRSRSNRATITPTSFVNEYHWGDLKGDPLDWVRRHFDAHVYSANWGNCRLVLRLPPPALDEATLNDFSQLERPDTDWYEASAFTITDSGEHWILDWEFNDDSGEFERFWSQTDGPGWMTRLLPLRDELLRGDLRPLYLGWLARVCAGELEADALEPPLPAGMATLTPAQQALAEFLMIDPDWLGAAAQASSARPAPALDERDFDAWISEQSTATMQTVLRALLAGRSQEAERNVRRDFLSWQRSRQTPAAFPPRRGVADIEAGLETVRSQRLERESQARAAEVARRQAERTRYLARLAEDPERVWKAIDATLQRGSGAAYDEALQMAEELAAALIQAGRETEFRAGLARLQITHGNRKAWLARLAKAGLGA